MWRVAPDGRCAGALAQVVRLRKGCGMTCPTRCDMIMEWLCSACDNASPPVAHIGPMDRAPMCVAGACAQHSGVSQPDCLCPDAVIDGGFWCAGNGASCTHSYGQHEPRHGRTIRWRLSQPTEQGRGSARQYAPILCCCVFIGCAVFAAWFCRTVAARRNAGGGHHPAPCGHRAGT